MFWHFCSFYWRSHRDVNETGLTRAHHKILQVLIINNNDVEQNIKIKRFGKLSRIFGTQNGHQKSINTLKCHLRKDSEKRMELITFGNGRAGLQWIHAISATFGSNGREYDTLGCPFCKMKLTLPVKSYTFGTSLPKWFRTTVCNSDIDIYSQREEEIKMKSHRNLFLPADIRNKYGKKYSQ